MRTYDNGNDVSFEEIFKLHHRRVYALCLRMTGNVAEAEDLTQEVFVQVFRNLESFRGDAAFSTWLHRVAVNQVLMHFRRKLVRKEQITKDGELPDEPMESSRRFNRAPVLDRIMKRHLPLLVDLFSSSSISSIASSLSSLSSGLPGSDV